MGIPAVQENINNWFVNVSEMLVDISDQFSTFYSQRPEQKLQTLQNMRIFSQEVILKNAGGDVGLNAATDLYLNVYAKEIGKLIAKPYRDNEVEELRHQEATASVTFAEFLETQAPRYHRDFTKQPA